MNLGKGEWARWLRGSQVWDRLATVKADGSKQVRRLALEEAGKYAVKKRDLQGELSIFPLSLLANLCHIFPSIPGVILRWWVLFKNAAFSHFSSLTQYN
ncbi:hypothetical protein Pla52o_22540 [Novipirellula galeiformis]|uniref:Uncharacterized protein n=1 Tax=Novipirellula galeiformis TaxID=2528004 RepID=A0A5C6CL93_9BACT|nr:hypothetical protein [Novipirellula galeiformis]TWU24327.1 hypothetical protein Pla52o_22540 [Novipirellula galeiformis]